MTDDLSAAGVALALFVLLGRIFARKPFAFVDRIGARISGTAVPIAVVFTRSGYTPALTGLATLGALGAIALRAPLAPVAVLIAFQLLGQLAANAAKRYVARLRPEVWHFREELGFAYPSGHAVTAIIFYVGWATLITRWPLFANAHAAIFELAAAWALGIGWSRVALGAHRITDIIGGYLLGGALLCVLVALLPVLTR